MNGVPIRILVVGETAEAQRVREMLALQDCPGFQTVLAEDLSLAAERLSHEHADVLLVDLGSKQSQGRAFVQAARAAAPDMPMVIVAEHADESLAIEALREGVQDFLDRDHLDHATLARSLRHSIERHRLQKNLQNLSLLDDLTALYNRRGFMALAGQHLRMIQRKGAALLIYLDLDGLKQINDTFGHLEGNRALILTANILRACFRQSDILARLGGDEFCVLMTDAGQDTGQHVRRRLQQRTELVNALSLSQRRFRLSLSMGITDVPVVHQPSLDELLRLADKLMYEEKRGKQPREPVVQDLKLTTTVV